jgi:predicted transcriptional regulator
MTTISIRIEDDEKEQIQKYADEHDLSMSQVIRRAIREFLAESAADKD